MKANQLPGMPAEIPDELKTVREAAAKLIQAATDEKFYIVGAVFRKDGFILTLQNTDEDVPELMRAAADMVEKRSKGPHANVVQDHVRRMN